MNNIGQKKNNIFLRKTAKFDTSSLSAPCQSGPPHVLNGMRIYMGQGHGFRAKYKCFAGFQLTGMDGTYLTCEFGVWTGGTPQCTECKLFD
jgi:hypothetical protein